MINKVSGLIKDTSLLAALLSVAVACGSVNTQEVAQSKAVRDRSRVLGLAQMDDGTYQFRLCRLHETYTADILANECINPLVNEDGTEKVFNHVPDKPGTAMAKFRNWLTAALAGTIAGVIIYKIGRFYVKTKARDRLVGKAMWERHKAKVDGAKAHNDFELVERLGRDTAEEGGAVVGGKDFTQAIAFVESYGTKVEKNIEKARNAIKDALAQPLKADIDAIQESLEKARKVLTQEDSGFNLDSKPIQDLAQAIAALAKQADELRGTGARELGNRLQEMERDAYNIFKHVHSKEGLRLQLSGEEKKALEAVAKEDSAIAKAVRDWTHSKEELSLLDDEGLSEINARLLRLQEKLDEQGSSDKLEDEIRKVKDEKKTALKEIEKLEKVFVGLKDVKDETVEKLIRIDDVAMKDDRAYRGDGEKTILQLKQDIERHEQTLKDNTGQKDPQTSAKLAETKAALKERIKSYNPSQKQPMINEEQEKVGMAIKADPVIARAEEAAKQAKEAMQSGDGLFANSLGKISNGIKGGVKFLRGFPWLGKDTLAYGKLNKITVTDEDKIVDKLAHDVKVENIEVQKGVEKLAAQTVGISAFLSLPLTSWSRYLPAHALLSAEKNWTEVTGDYVAAKRIDDMLTILDGIAQATDAKVTPSAVTFGL